MPKRGGNDLCRGRFSRTWLERVRHKKNSKGFPLEFLNRIVEMSDSLTRVGH